MFQGNSVYPLDQQQIIPTNGLSNPGYQPTPIDSGDFVNDYGSSVSLDSRSYDDGHARYVRNVSRLVLVVVAFLLAIAALGLGILVIVDNRWITYTFNATPNDSTRMQQYNRVRGMFKICNTTVNALCINTDFGYQVGGDYNYYFLTSMELAHVSLFIIGVIIIFCVLVLTIISQIMLFLTKYAYRAYACIYTMLAIMFVVSAFCTGTSTILFDVTISEEASRNTTFLNYAYAQWNYFEQNNTVMYRDYDYALGWVVCWLTLLAAILYFITVCIECGASSRARRHQLYHINQDGVTDALSFKKTPVYNDLHPTYIKSTDDLSIYNQGNNIARSF